MRSERRPIAQWVVLSLAAALAGCGGFGRGERWDETTSTVTGASESEGGGPSFAADVHPALVDACGGCHAPGASAGDTGLVLTGVAEDDLAGVLDLVDLERPADSRLLTKAAGVSHVGGALFAPGSPEYETVLAWIAAGTPP